MHVNEAGVLVDLHESVEDMLGREKGKLRKLWGLVNTHVGAMRYGAGVVRSKVEIMLAAHTGGEEEEEEADRAALQSELLLAEANLKQMKAVKGMVDNIIAEHEEMKSS